MKPDNVFLLNKDGDTDFVKIVDFGIAKSVGGFDNPPVSVQVQEPQADAFAATIAQPSTRQGASPAAPAIAVTLDGLGPAAAQLSAVSLGVTPAAAGMPLAAGAVAATISGEALGPVSSTPAAAFAATTAQPPVDAKSAMQTSAGRVLGTPHYMAPEQCRAQPVDSRADQYAVGCMLYEMLTGELVFPETSPMQILTKHCEEPPQPLRQRAPQQNIPEALEAVVLRMLAKDPRQRFASMNEVSQVLGEIADGLLFERGEKVVPPTGVWGLLGARLQGSYLIVRGRKVSLRAVRMGLLSILILMVGSVGFLGYRLYQAQKPPKATLEPGELQLIKGRALAVLRAAAASADTEPQLRLDAITALGRTQDAGLRPLLESILGDPNEVVQAEAAAALGHLGVRAASGALQTTMAKAGGGRVRLTAARALLDLSLPSGEEVLVRTLATGEPEERLRAASLLCDRRNPAAEKLLLQVVDGGLLKEESAALGALGCLLSSQSAEAARQRLHSRLKDAPTPPQQIEIARVLAHAGDTEGRRVLRALAQQPGLAQLPAAQALAAPDVPEVSALFRRVLDDRQAQDAARQLASEGLGQSGQLLDVRLLGRHLDGAAAAVQEAAAVAVLRLGAADPTALGSESLRWARSSLGSDDWQLRASAAQVLGESSSADAVSLLQGLLRDRDARVRSGTARALGRRPEAGALLVLRDALRDSDADVRLEALRSIKRLSQGLVKSQGRSVLGQVSEWLDSLLRTGLPKERILAQATLLQLGDASQKQALQSSQTATDPELRRFLLEQAPAEAGLAAGMLSDADPGVRFAAARQLAEGGDARAIDILKQTIAQGGRDSIIAYGLMIKLGQRVEEPAALQSAMQTGRPVLERMAAVEAMGSMPEALAVPLLLQAARDPEPLVRRLSAEIAADLPQTALTGAGVPVLRFLLGDLDLVVRNRAAALLSRLTLQSAPPPEKSASPSEGADPAVSAAASTSPAAAGVPAPSPTTAGDAGDPAAEDPDEGPAPGAAAASKGSLVLEVPEGVLFRIDSGKWQTATGKSLSLVTGPHHVTTLGDEYDVTIEADKKVRLKLSSSPVDEAVQSGSRAYQQKEFTKAQKQYERASFLCGRDRARKKACVALELSLAANRGLIFEQQRRFSEAMAEYQRALSTRGPGRIQAAEAINRLAPQLGKVILRHSSRGKCKERVQWLLPGKKQKIKVGKQSQAVNVRAGQTVEIGQCR